MQKQSYRILPDPHVSKMAEKILQIFIQEKCSYSNAVVALEIAASKLKDISVVSLGNSGNLI